MAWRSGSLSRSFMSSTRALLRPSTSSPLTRLPPPPTAAPRIQFRRFSRPISRNLGPLGCTQSLLPLHGTMAIICMTSHLSVSERACCELSHGDPDS